MMTTLFSIQYSDKLGISCSFYYANDNTWDLLLGDFGRCWFFKNEALLDI